jgi:acetyl-CoA/propionyl-CoA carboxylase biotin carboxyl carrier protein
MGAAAVALARACGYEGAGTVEFIATGDASAFYFLEMNTRLQVEHPVTELVYGLDLVEQQLRVAAGEELVLEQDLLAPLGHAVEARLYAEDPAGGFLPATGVVKVHDLPAGEGVRVDTGIRMGSAVGTSYDPMLAKVVAYGADRATALDRLDRALATYAIAGVTTNAAFTRALIGRDDVRAGEQDTGLLERVLDELAVPPPADLAAAAMLAAAGTASPQGPWRRDLDDLGEARIAGGVVTIGEQRWEGAAFAWDTTTAGFAFATLDGLRRRYAIAVGDDEVHVFRDGHHLAVRTHRPARSGAAALAGSLEAPMPGTVWAVNVSNGDAVQEGDVLIVLESMKMELSITAPRAGVVEGLELAAGDRVALRQPLLAVVEAGA